MTTKRICNICNENKINIFAYWFGLRHCEECEQKPLIESVNRSRLKLTRIILESYDKGYYDDYNIGKELDKICP